MALCSEFDRSQAMVRLGHDQLAGHHEDLLGRQRDDLAGAQRRQRRRQRAGPGDRGEDEVAVGVGDHLLDPLFSAGIGRPDRVPRLPRQRPLAGQQAEDLEAVGEAVDHVQRLAADRPGRAQDGDPEPAHRSSPPKSA